MWDHSDDGQMLNKILSTDIKNSKHLKLKTFKTQKIVERANVQKLYENYMRNLGKVLR